MDKVSYRIRIDAEECKRFPGLSGPTVQGQEIKDYSADILKKIEEYDLLPYEVIHKAKINITGDRIILEEYDDENEFIFEKDFIYETDTTVDKTEENDYPYDEDDTEEDEDYICGADTQSGRPCQISVDSPKETCRFH